MLPSDTIAKLRAKDQARFDAAVAALLGEAGIQLSWSPGQFVRVFDAWLGGELKQRGWEAFDSAILVAAARDQVEWTSALRIISEDAFQQTKTELLSTVDINVMGSIGRGEACAFSDHDLVVIALNDAEMISFARLFGAAAGALVASPARPVEQPKEDARSDAVRATKWLQRFLEVMRNDNQYTLAIRADGSVKLPDAYLVTVPDFEDKRILKHQAGYFRHGGNLINSRFPLREDNARTAAVLTRVTATTDRGELAGHRLDAMDDARLGMSNPYRPHAAHKLLTQTWQALLFFLEGVRPRKLPYWSAPLFFDFDLEARHEWRAGIQSISAARRSGQATAIGANYVIGAALSLVRSAPLRTGRAARGVDLKVKVAMERRLK